MDRCHFCLVTQYLNFLLIPEESLIRYVLGGRYDFHLTTCQLPGHEHDLAWTIRYFDLDLGSQVGDSKMKGQLEFIPGSRKLSLVVAAAVFCRRAGCHLGGCSCLEMVYPAS